MEDFVGAKFYCLHALADNNQHIRIREKTLVNLTETVCPIFFYKNYSRQRTDNIYEQ